MKNKNIGSSFDGWLREEGIHEEVTATAIKRVLARQVEAAMEEKKFSKAQDAHQPRFAGSPAGSRVRCGHFKHAAKSGHSGVHPTLAHW
jgi:hypothetical protein